MLIWQLCSNEKVNKDPINQKNPNTYMFTKHIQTYIHNEKKFKQTTKKSKSSNWKNLNLKFHVFYPSLAQKQGWGIIPKLKRSNPKRDEGSSNSTHHTRRRNQETTTNQIGTLGVITMHNDK